MLVLFGDCQISGFLDKKKLIIAFGWNFNLFLLILDKVLIIYIYILTPFGWAKLVGLKWLDWLNLD